jgi:hypothetical protein
MVWFMYVLFGCGGSSDFGEKEEGFQCSSNYECDWDLYCDNSQCNEIFGQNFIVTINEISADTSFEFDSFGGAPDFYVYFGFTSQECTTSVSEDDFFPMINESCTGNVQESDVFSLYVYEADLTSDDLYLYTEINGGSNLSDLIKLEESVFNNDYLSISLSIRPQ